MKLTDDEKSMLNAICLNLIKSKTIQDYDERLRRIDKLNGPFSKGLLICLNYLSNAVEVDAKNKAYLNQAFFAQLLGFSTNPIGTYANAVARSLQWACGFKYATENKMKILEPSSPLPKPNTIEIKVIGPACSGKSTIIAELERVLNPTRQTTPRGLTITPKSVHSTNVEIQRTALLIDKLQQGRIEVVIEEVRTK